MDSTSKSLAPFVRHAGEGEAYWWLGSLAVIKAERKETGGHFTLIEVLENEGETPLHIHHREDETFLVLQGEIEFLVDGKRIKAGPGDTVFGPKGIPHGYTVRKGPARMLFLLTPGGFEDLVRASSIPALAKRIPSAEDAIADFAALPPIAMRFGCEMLG
jgi:quercetin dioxygenase-like cupin family protein